MAKPEQDSNYHSATTLVNAGRRPEWTGAVVSPPVWRASTHLYANTAELNAGRPNKDGYFYYGRRGAPTQWALAEALTQLEPGAAGTVLYPSGVSAIVGTLMTFLRPGDVLLVTDNAYEPSRVCALGILKEFGIEARFFDPLSLDSFRDAICPKTRFALLESPGSLTMEVCDIPALTKIARDHSILTAIDNTWASSLGFPALAHGADISIMALTKHAGGHSDLMMGSASAGAELYSALRKYSQATGIVVSPDDAALALRGLRTMGIRLERKTASALEIATWLSAQPQIAHVLCPMLAGSPGHDLWVRDFTGGCGLFTVILKGGSASDRDRMIDNLRLFGIGYSWGGFESLAIPVDPSGARSATPWPPAQWDPADQFGLRLEIGLEDPRDLIADLARALGQFNPASA